MFTHDHQVLAPGFLSCLALVAGLGSILMVLGNILGSILVPGHDFISDTVSDLAAGRYEIIQDVALYGFAAALVAMALACAHLHDGAVRISLLTLALVLLALCVVVIGARNEYGDGDNAGVVVHIYIVYALGALFAAAFALAALELGRIAGFMVPLSWGCLALWVIGAPVFFLMPTEWDGLWERGLGMIAVIWSLGFAVALHGYAGTARDNGA